MARRRQQRDLDMELAETRCTDQGAALALHSGLGGQVSPYHRSKTEPGQLEATLAADQRAPGAEQDLRKVLCAMGPGHIP